MTDRLALIRARHEEAGGGDADKAWLIDEVERLRGIVRMFLDADVYGLTTLVDAALEAAHEAVSP